MGPLFKLQGTRIPFFTQTAVAIILAAPVIHVVSVIHHVVSSTYSNLITGEFHLSPSHNAVEIVRLRSVNVTLPSPSASIIRNTS